MTKLHGYHYPEHGDAPIWAIHLEHLMENTMATSKEALTSVEALNSKVDALVASKGGVPADVQADLDSIKSSADALGVKLDAAVTPVVVVKPVV